jgi:type III pantothenate kinase
MRKLIIDQGNTLVKAAVFEDKILVKKEVLSDISDISSWLLGIDKVIYASVNDRQDLIPYFKDTPFLNLSDSTPLPISNLYNTPETLGVDRIAGVVAANFLYPKSNNLIVDAGTCITYDFIDSDSNYTGGSISLGLKMRFKALHNQTHSLPLIEEINHFDLIGTDTYTSITSGVINGLLIEIDGIISRYKDTNPELNTIITGGDSVFFEKALKNSIFAHPDLIFIGLNEILDYNEASI